MDDSHPRENDASSEPREEREPEIDGHPDTGFSGDETSPDDALVPIDDEFFHQEVAESEIPSLEDDDLEAWDEDEELSLDALSEAYAEVIGNQDVDESTTLTECQPSDPSMEDVSEPNDIEESLPTSRKEDIDWDDVLADELAACPISPESIIEAILFVGAPNDTKLNSRVIASLLRDVSPKEVTKLAKQLRSFYEENGFSFHLHSQQGVHHLELNREHGELQHLFLGRDKPVKLNQAVIDVLAVVAYNQPVSKHDVEAIRARSSGRILNQLARRNLIAVDESTTDPRTKMYVTTERFLELFDLESLDDLPEIEMFMGD